jgi:hypothetical protein
MTQILLTRPEVTLSPSGEERRDEGAFEPRGEQSRTDSVVSKPGHFNPNSEMGMGGTGDPPVPSGHWPDGRDRTLALKTDARKSSSAFLVPSGGSPLGTGQWPVLPAEMAAAVSESGFKPPRRIDYAQHEERLLGLRSVALFC